MVKKVKSPIKENELPNFVSKMRRGSPKGVQCFFVPLSKKWALKCYNDEYERDSCWHYQQLLEEHDLAPITGQKIDISVPSDDDKWYCYITEIVQTISRSEYIDFSEQGLVRKLIRDVEKVVGFWEDCHYENVGIKNGQLICIDCGFMGDSEDSCDDYDDYDDCDS